MQQVAHGFSHQRIEMDSGKPVATNTQAWTWDTVHGMGLRDLIAGYGRLLRHT